MDNNQPEKRKFGAKVSAFFGELKKVTWPTFAKVMAQTGVVIAVTLFFLLILMGIDFGLSKLYELLAKGLEIPDSTTTTQSLMQIFSVFGSPANFGSLIL